MNTSFDDRTEANAGPLSSRRMFADTLTVGAWSAVTKGAGALKIILAARLFGAGDAMDAYLIAFLVPSFFMEMLAGPLDSALIPSLIEVREKQGRASEEALYSTALVCAGAVLLAAAVFAAAASGWMVPALGGSFSSGKLALTRQMLLAMIAVVPLSGLSCTWRAVLNSHHQFAYAAAVPAITPIVSIIALLAGGKQYGVFALAIGTLVGGSLEAILGCAGVKRLGYPVIPRWMGMTAPLRQVALQYAPLVAMTMVMTGSTLVDQGLAARLGSGSVAVLSYGTKLLSVLIVIGPTAVGTAVLPHISSAAARAGAGGERKNLWGYVLAIAAVIVPATVALVYFSEPIVRVLFQQGAFNHEATRLVAAVQKASLLQLPLTVLLAFEIRLTSAWKANRLLYRVAALSVALTFVLDLIFMRWIGVIGIALAGVGMRLVSSLYLSCKIYRLRGFSSSLSASG
jgi:putative peptidoglycan lipid II flippase